MVREANLGPVKPQSHGPGLHCSCVCTRPSLPTCPPAPHLGLLCTCGMVTDGRGVLLLPTSTALAHRQWPRSKGTQPSPWRPHGAGRRKLMQETTGTLVSETFSVESHREVSAAPRPASCSREGQLLGYAVGRICFLRDHLGETRGADSRGLGSGALSKALLVPQGKLPRLRTGMGAFLSPLT